MKTRSSLSTWSLSDKVGVPWVIVAGSFHRLGGMDKANAALADYLLARGTPVSLVAHHVDHEFSSNPSVTFYRVPRPAGSFFLGELLLDRRGRAVASAVTAKHPGAHVVVNGGNCAWPGINWVHCVHRAWPAFDSGAPAWFKIKARMQKALARSMERFALRRARVILANSERTRRDLIEQLGILPDRIHTVYLATGAACAPSSTLRSAAREWLGLDSDRPAVAFVGALGYDSNKGFDTLWSAWRMLCARFDWDAQLLVVGGGRALESWRTRVATSGLAHRVTMLGFTDRVGEVLAASDLLVSPVRYEGYGLNVHEALCRGVPAMVSASAGVAERYPSELGELLLPDPEDAGDLAKRILSWRTDICGWKLRVVPLANSLRQRTWEDMAHEIVAIAENSAATMQTATTSRIELESARK